MAKTNKRAKNTVKTYEGHSAVIGKGPSQLERQVATCMLWEPTFYESGEELVRQILQSCETCSAEDIASLAIKARTDFKLRHVPLLLLYALDKKSKKPDSLLRETIPLVIQRPDEMAELLSIIAKLEEKPVKTVLSAQVKRGLADTFPRFSEYQLAKWNRDRDIKLRDVLFLCHAKPKDSNQEATWKKLVDGTLESPDTWEVALSSGADKKETFTRLLEEGKLGYIALLMNLRNMSQAGVSKKLVETNLIERSLGSKALPFRFLTAARHAPDYADALNTAMLGAIDREHKLDGETWILVDVSGSMSGTVSSKSELRLLDAASGLAVLVREICSSARVFTFSNRLVEVPNHRGIPLVNGIKSSQPMGGTELGKALQGLNKHPNAEDCNRIIVVTDEQAHPTWGGGSTLATTPNTKTAYLMNVAAYKPGLQLEEKWVRINGWSERVIDWIRWNEESLNG